MSNAFMVCNLFMLSHDKHGKTKQMFYLCSVNWHGIKQHIPSGAFPKLLAFMVNIKRQEAALWKTMEGKNVKNGLRTRDK